MRRTTPSGGSSAALSSGDSTQPRTTGRTGAPERSAHHAPWVPSSVTWSGVSTR
ncbi:Uncharacterised protein [Mycobacteroides abscessus]|nr:Uncharacterised protein [Mycobacteroides abscessus]